MHTTSSHVWIEDFYLVKGPVSFILMICFGPCLLGAVRGHQVFYGNAVVIKTTLSDIIVEQTWRIPSQYTS